MLSVLTARLPAHAEEPEDRDPGFLTLAFTVIRALRREGRDGSERPCDHPRETRPRD